ncbi:hypothetical protein BS47DRAFT_1347999 [Hydnum rufescens UP504]|uniref:amidase n=1 Tax=Hydnum rufescens UP504 TaxID=1448309 RepID=A0A9P6AS44_9AGAM|nr:hypothetical protein BS47DRAFT_1347999 [Hydnum rufescens UP504]
MGRTKDISRQKRAQREAAIKTAKDFTGNSPPSIEYTQASAVEIVNHIRNGDQGWTATRVLDAYLRRALAVQDHINFMTEPLFESAFKDAKMLDEEFAATGRLRGPLHGVPISLKDLFHVKGVDASIGYSLWANKPSHADADVVKLIREAGGIPFVKTNVPQTLISFECSNPVFGTTANPYPSPSTGKRIFTSGGSSGGEAALLACDGSALGLGSDLGGSLRIPAHFCGIYSFKPTPGRISTRGSGPSLGFESLVVSIGPMARSVADLKVTCELLFGKLDSKLPIPYRPGLDTFDSGRKLKFGYYLSGMFRGMAPGISTMMNQPLRAAGHECVEFRPPKISDALRIFIGLTAADGYRALTKPIGPDPKESFLFLVTLGPRLPGFLRSSAAWLAKTVMHDPIFAEAFRNSKIRSTLSPLAISTIVFNVTSSPVGVIPVTRVDPSLDHITEEWKSGAIASDGTRTYPSGRRGSKILEKTLYEGFLGDPKRYDPVAMAGLPVGIQIVGRWNEDEKLMGLMKIVDDALGERGFGPGSSFKGLQFPEVPIKLDTKGIKKTNRVGKTKKTKETKETKEIKETKETKETKE